jgi:hypothetical protein
MDGKMEYCRKDLKDGNINLDNEFWELIYDSYVTKFGLNKLHAKLIDVIRKKALLECEFVITQDRFKLTMIEVEEQKIILMLKNAGNGIDIRESLIYISKWMGQWINPKQITTLDFFNLQKQYERFNSTKKNE